MDSTSDTVNECKSLIVARGIDPLKVCALLDKKEGLDDIKEQVKSGLKLDIGIISTACIYDDIFRQVRLSLRAGKTCQQIQDELDHQLHIYSRSK
jgi:hypothetical protein